VKKITLPLLCVTALLLIADGRVWTNREGRTFEGEFVDSKNNIVSIRRASDLKRFSMPVASLSKADQDYIKTYIENNKISFNWSVHRKGLSYSYSTHVKTSDTKGTYSYTDRSRKKLLDGVFKSKWSSHSVGWLDSTPPAILLKFRAEVQPESIRIYIFGKKIRRKCFSASRNNNLHWIEV